MKTSGGVAIQPLDPLRRRQSRPLAGMRDQLHPRAKTAGGETPLTRKPSLIQPQDARAPTTGAKEEGPTAAVGKTHQRQANVKANLVERNSRDLRLCRDFAQSPHAGHGDARQLVVCDGHWRTSSA